MKRSQNSYCYVITLSPTVAEAARRLELTSKGKKGGREIFFGAQTGSDDRYISVINNIGDYDVDNIREWLKSGGRGVPQYDSLVSAAFIIDDGFVCMGDHFAINSHYWYRDEKTFCCSDNVFAIAEITGVDLSRESLWEYLFFLSPIKERTWFEGVKKLRPGQSIKYSSESHNLSLSEPYDLDVILNSNNVLDMNDAITTFLEGAKRVLRDRNVAVSISAGSDSNTVLSCVRGMKIPFRGYSFGTPYLVETRHIANNAKRFGFDWTMIDMMDMKSDWRDRFRQTLYDTNGLLNPYRTHYEDYYKAISPEFAVFEGILGSELLKGEYAIGSTISKAHLAAITSAESSRQIVEREFEGLPQSFRKGMAEYISDVHGNWLTNVNTDAGFSDFRSFALEFEPGRIMAGMILQGARDHDVYQLFASPMILGASFRSKFGIARNLSIREDFCGPALILEAEALIVREMDKEIYNHVLDRGISFREALTLPYWWMRLIKKYRNGLSKIRNRKYRFGQVDNRSIHDDILKYVASKDVIHPLIGELLSGEQYQKEAATLSMILELLREDSTINKM